MAWEPEEPEFDDDVDGWTDKDQSEWLEAVREAGTAERVWQAEVVPMLRGTEDEAGTHVVAVVITAELFAIHASLHDGVTGEGEEVAALLADALEETVAEVGLPPEAVLVRQPAVAVPLRALLRPRGVDVRFARELPGVETVVRGVFGDDPGGATWPPSNRRENWRSWQLPEELVTELFAAAAGYWRRAPWELVTSQQAPLVLLPWNHTWAASALGRPGPHVGLGLYAVPSDCYDPQSSPGALAGISGMLLQLHFEDVESLSPHAVDEARSAGREIADDRAFPVLYTVNSPAGGISQVEARDLIAVLRSLPDFIETHRHALLHEAETGEPVAEIYWLHAASDVRYRYQGEGTRHRKRLAVPAPPWLTGEIRSVFEKAVRDATANLGSATERSILEAAGVELFRERAAAHPANRAAREFGGLTPLQLDTLLRSDWTSDGAIVLRRDLTLEELEGARIFSNVRTVLSFAAERGGLPGAGVLDETTIAELLERMGPDPVFGTHDRTDNPGPDWEPTEAQDIGELLGLLERDPPCMLTPRGREMLEPENAGTLYAAIFAACFGPARKWTRTGWKWPELDEQLPYTIFRLAHRGPEWFIACDALDTLVLPYAAEKSMRTPLDMASLGFELNILIPLRRLGLLESEPRDAADSLPQEAYRASPLLRRFFAFNL